MKNITPFEWVQDSACRTTDPENFYPDSDDTRATHVRHAVAICAECPVRLECLEYALEFEQLTGTRHGIFGGLTPRQRNALAREARRRLPARVLQLAGAAPLADVRAWAIAHGYLVGTRPDDRVRIAYAIATHRAQHQDPATREDAIA